MIWKFWQKKEQKINWPKPGILKVSKYPADLFLYIIEVKLFDESCIQFQLEDKIENHGERIDLAPYNLLCDFERNRDNWSKTMIDSYYENYVIITDHNCITSVKKQAESCLIFNNTNSYQFRLGEIEHSLNGNQIKEITMTTKKSTVELIYNSVERE